MTPAFRFGSMAEEADADALTLGDLFHEPSFAEIDELAGGLMLQAGSRVPLCVTEEERAARLRRFQRRLTHRVNAAKTICANEEWLKEKEREEKALADWAEANKLPLRSTVRDTRGRFKNREGEVMPFGQRELHEVLVGLSDYGALTPELARVPRSFVRLVKVPPPPPASAFRDGKLDLSALWGNAASKLEYSGG